MGGNPTSLVDPSGLVGVLPFPGAAAAAEAGGLGTAGALTAPLTLSGDTTNRTPYYYATYTRKNRATGQTYCGRTSGYGDPQNLVRNRGLQQSLLNAEGFSAPELDQYSTDYGAIRGREQQLIDYYGGAQSVGGAARNMINGVGPLNPNGPFYNAESTAQFGGLPDNSPARFRFW